MPNASSPKSASEYLDRMVRFTSDPRLLRYSGLHIYLAHLLKNPSRPAEIIQDMVDCCREHDAFITSRAGAGGMPSISVRADDAEGISFDQRGSIAIRATGDVVRFDSSTIISKDMTRMWDLGSHTGSVRGYNCLNDGRTDDIEGFLKTNTRPVFAQRGTLNGDPFYAPAIGSHDVCYTYANPTVLEGWEEGLIPKVLRDTVILTLLRGEQSVADEELDSLLHDDCRGDVGWTSEYFVLLSRPVAELHLEWWKTELARVHDQYPDKLDLFEDTDPAYVEQMLYHHKSCHSTVGALERMFEVMDGRYEDPDVAKQVANLVSSSLN